MVDGVKVLEPFEVGFICLFGVLDSGFWKVGDPNWVAGDGVCECLRLAFGADDWVKATVRRRE